jgi:hypothetical protein
MGGYLLDLKQGWGVNLSQVRSQWHDYSKRPSTIHFHSYLYFIWNSQRIWVLFSSVHWFSPTNTMVQTSESRLCEKFGVYKKGQDSIVGTATGYGPDDLGAGVRVLVGERIFTSPYRADRLWGPSNVLSHRYRGLFPQGHEADHTSS